eukprot:IDg7958t1
MKSSSQAFILALSSIKNCSSFSWKLAAELHLPRVVHHWRLGRRTSQPQCSALAKSWDRGTVDIEVVYSEPIHSRRTLRDDERSGNPLRGGNIPDKFKLDKLVDISSYKIALWRWVPSLLSSDWSYARLPANAERFNVCWLTAIYIASFSTLFSGLMSSQPSSSSRSASSALPSAWNTPCRTRETCVRPAVYLRCMQNGPGEGGRSDARVQMRVCWCSASSEAVSSIFIERKCNATILHLTVA